jgi:hypothetical protein
MEFLPVVWELLSVIVLGMGLCEMLSQVLAHL